MMIKCCHENGIEVDFEITKAVKDILIGTEVFPVPRTCEVLYRTGRDELGITRAYRG